MLDRIRGYSSCWAIIKQTGETNLKRIEITYDSSPGPGLSPYSDLIVANLLNVFKTTIRLRSSLQFIVGELDCYIYNANGVSTHNYCTDDFKNTLAADKLKMEQVALHWKDEDKFFMLLKDVEDNHYIFREYLMKYYTLADSPKVSNPDSFDSIEPSESSYNLKFEKSMFGEFKGITRVHQTSLIFLYFKKYSSSGLNYKNRLC